MRWFYSSCALFSLCLICASCGPKKSTAGSRTVHSNQSDQFNDLSLDDIRNNIELFDVVVEETIDNEKTSRQKPMSFDEYQARLIDIALPFKAQLLDRYRTLEGEDDHVVLGYTTPMPFDDVVSFYTKEMERLGWSSLCQVRGYEYLFVFEKPSRLCSIVLRSGTQAKRRAHNRPTEIVMFLTPVQRYS